MANAFDLSSASTSSVASAQRAQQNISNTISTLAKGGSGPNVLKQDGSIDQTERLFTARARYGKNEYLTGKDRDLGGNRGQWAYIKLLTSNKQYAEYLSGSTSRKVTYKDLLGGESEVAKMAATPKEGKDRGYDKFLITGVSSSLNEKVQITEVFGDHEVVYYFGRQPMVFNISGLLIDSPDNDWFVTWLKMYGDFLRGSETARNYELLKIVLPNMAITGTISAFSWQQSADRDVDIPFNIQFIAKVIEPLPATLGVGETMVSSPNLKYVDFSKVAKFTSLSQINGLKAQMNTLSGVIKDPTSSLRAKGAALGQVGSGTGGAFDSFLLSSKDNITGFQKTVDEWSKSQNNYFKSVQSSAMYQSVTSSLNGIRTNLFSPIYGVMSSLSKLVASTFKNITNVISGVITPVRNILRDITNISNQAIALVNQVNNSITGLGRYVKGQIAGTKQDFNTAIKSMKKAAGVIASSPKSVGQSISAMLKLSVLPNNAPFLKISPKLTVAKPTLGIASLGGAPSRPASRATLALSIPDYSPSTSNSL